MDLDKCIKGSLEYMEDHIEEDISIEDLAKNLGVSPIYYQKCFSLLCGYSPAEYLRNRKMTLAGQDLLLTDMTIMELTQKYGYSSQESFSKAFYRFHGMMPNTARKEQSAIKSFTPIKVINTFEGGDFFNYRVVKKEAFTVIANRKKLPFTCEKGEITEFWENHFESKFGSAIKGEYGITKTDGNGFEYLIADDYTNQIMEGTVIETIPASCWLIFDSKDIHANTLHVINTKVFSHMITAFPNLLFNGEYLIEHFKRTNDYEFWESDLSYEVWIPVTKESI